MSKILKISNVRKMSILEMCMELDEICVCLENLKDDIKINNVEMSEIDFLNNIIDCVNN